MSIDIDNAQGLIQGVQKNESAKLAAIVESSQDAIISQTLESIIVSWNKSAERLFGYSAAEIIGKHISILIPLELCYEENLILEKIKRGETLNSYETKRQRKDGSTFNIELTISPIWGDVDTVIGVSKIARDITKRKEIEAENKKLSNRLTLALKSGAIGCWEWDIVSNTKFWDQRMYELYGFTQDQNIPTNSDDWAKCLHPDDRIRCKTLLEQAVLGQEEYNTEFRVIHTDGSIHFIKAYGMVIRDSQNNPQSMIGVNFDITKRKLAEEEKNRLLSFLDASLNEIYLFDASTLRFIYVNQGGIKNLGYDIETLKTMTPLNINPDFNEIEYGQLIQPLLEGNVEELIFETRHQRSDGSCYSVEVRLQQHKYQNKQFCLAVILDITERKKAEMILRQTNEELIRATRLKDEFLANMSHELRTPLNAILGMSEILEEGIFGFVNKEQIGALQTVRNSGQHLLSLINDILDLAKIESGEVMLDLKPTSIDYLCRASLAFIQQQAIHKNITTKYIKKNDLPEVYIDELKIRQVLINLLNNAVKFTLENGKITLEVNIVTHTPERNFLRIAISDTGIGIAKENIHKLFKPFIQIDSALNRQYDGTGLGLSLVKRIVELHGGQVGVTSELNVGSCFTIDLPITINVEASNTEQIVPLESNSVFCTMEKSLILLAEDNEANIITFSCYLKAIGYQVEIARNGREAIDLTRSCKPDLILMDISMPGMDGLEAIKQIRLNPNWINIPIIALTALAMPGDRERCLEAGANEYLTKPLKMSSLLSTIKQFLIIKP